MGEKKGPLVGIVLATPPSTAPTPSAEWAVVGALVESGYSIDRGVGCGVQGGGKRNCRHSTKLDYGNSTGEHVGHDAGEDDVFDYGSVPFDCTLSNTITDATIGTIAVAIISDIRVEDDRLVVPEASDGAHTHYAWKRKPCGCCCHHQSATALNGLSKCE